MYRPPLDVLKRNIQGLSTETLKKIARRWFDIPYPSKYDRFKHTEINAELKRRGEK